MAIDPAGRAAVLKYAAQSGDPIAYITTALVETGGTLNPRAVGDGGHSFGIFQLNDRGRLATFKLTPDQAFNPDTNARVSAQEFAGFAAKGYRGVRLALAAQRPSDPAYSRKYANYQSTAQSMWSGRSTSTGMPGAATSGVIGSGLTPIVNPLKDAIYSIIGKPGQGTHSYTAAPNNWQSDAAYDLSVPVGTNVYSPIGGTIVNAGPLGSSDPRMAGIRVTVKGVGLYGDYVVYLAHLSALADGIKPGAQVRAGTLLGKSGSANGSPHLHFAVGTSTDTSESAGRPGNIPKLMPSESLGGGKFKGTSQGEGNPTIGDAIGGIPGAVKDAVTAPFAVASTVLEWIGGNALTALAYLVVAGVGVYLIARGSSSAFGTPTPADAARTAITIAATKGAAA